MKFNKHGRTFSSALELYRFEEEPAMTDKAIGQQAPSILGRICVDKRLGQWFVFSTQKQEIEIRVTRSGLLRVSEIRKQRMWKALND